MHCDCCSYSCGHGIAIMLAACGSVASIAAIAFCVGIKISVLYWIHPFGKISLCHISIDIIVLIIGIIVLIISIMALNIISGYVNSARHVSQCLFAH